MIPGPWPGAAQEADEVRPRLQELRGTWAFVTWGTMATILLVPFTNTFLPHTNRDYSVMSVTQLFFWACVLLSPRVVRRGYSSILMWMVVLFGIRYVYGWLLSDFPELMADSTRNMIRPMIWAWILAAVLRDERWRKRGCDAFVLGASLAAGLHAAGIGITGEITGALGTQRITAFELNPNVLGVIYATAFLIALARVIQPRTGYGLIARLAFGGSCALLMVGELLTGSRTAAVFTALGALVLVGVEMRRARWSLAAVFLSALVVGGAFAAGYSDSIIGKRSENVVDSGVGSEDRARMAPILVEQFLRSPTYGLGPENYRVELGNRSGTGDPGVGIVAHNQLFMFSVEMGLFGLIPFLTICFLLLRQAWRVREEEGGLPLALALPTVLTACTVANIAFHWHFHFIVGLVAGAFGAYKDRRAGAQGGEAA
ncbi:MAG TPA: O-antigen ligase family protein [Holophagaceae bacterium]|nr:O-antigen ligase family protein [Holophagaceae bacterium]